MKHLIKRLLYESVYEDLLNNAKNKLNEFKKENSEVIQKYVELKTLVDKLSYFKNVNYNEYYSEGTAGTTFLYVRVKYPFANLDGKSPWFTVHIGDKKMIDELSPQEKESLIQSRIFSYLTKRFGL